jgi:hypothetical protein
MAHLYRPAHHLSHLFPWRRTNHQIRRESHNSSRDRWWRLLVLLWFTPQSRFHRISRIRLRIHGRQAMSRDARAAFVTCIAIVVVIILGFTVLGGPGTQRLIRSDERSARSCRTRPENSAKVENLALRTASNS